MHPFPTTKRLAPWACAATALVAVGAFAGSADAASVKKVNKKKKTVIIDEGKDDGVEKGAKICFKDDEGTEVGCGKVTALKKSQAMVKVPAKALKAIKKGMTAEIKKGEGGESGEGEATAESTKSDGAKGKGASAGKHHRNLKVLYLMTPVGVSGMDRLAYNRPDMDAGGATQEVDSLWSPIGKANQSLLGLGLEVEFGLGTSTSLAVGFRTKKYTDFKIDADYNAQDGNHYAQTVQTFKSNGLWIDFYYLDIAMGTSFFFRVGNGIDVDISQATIDVKHKYDGPDGGAEGNNEFDIAKGSSKLTTISLRTVLNGTYFIDPIGFNFGLNLLLPLAGNASFTGEVKDPNAAKIKDGVTGEDDLKTKLGHKKQAFGAELVIGGFFAF